GLATAIATVAFGHAVVCAELLRSVAGDRGVASDARVGMEKIVDVRPGIRRWAGEVVVVGERDNVGAVLERGETVSDGGKPGHATGHVRHAEARRWDASADGTGGGQPVVEVGIGIPCGLVAEAAAKAVGLVADLEVLKLGAEGLVNELGLVGGAGRRAGAEVDAVKAGPSGGVEEGAQVANGLGRDGVGEIHRRALALWGLQDDVRWQRWLLAFGRGLRPADVGCIAAEPQDTVR